MVLVAIPSSPSSGAASPVLNEVKSPMFEPSEVGHLESTNSAQKKKKKRKPKKPAKPKDSEEAAPERTKQNVEPKQPVLCISRNKHWRYISSYHGPWLQLPLELLESLLVLNMDPSSISAAEARFPPFPSQSISTGKQRLFGPSNSPPPSPRTHAVPLALMSAPGKPTPPPIDPGVFRSVTTIRRLIDEASDLAVRAASGLSAAALGSMRSGGLGGNNSPWATAQSLGINLMGDQNTGRNVSMSAMRTHRLRVLAVQRLAAAYKADEIAASVMVMQGASALDDIAERVLKVDPNDLDAQYVHFFHEKIPSRQLAESTTTEVLDHLISQQPARLEYWRTRGIVRCFRDEYALATRDFTYALKEARAARKARHAHGPVEPEHRSKGGKKSKKNGGRSTGQAPPDGTAVKADSDPPPLHPSVLPEAPDPIEPQLLFLRGAAYLQNVVYVIEEAVLALEGVRKTPPSDGTELRLCYIENGKYGGVEIGNPAGPLGPKDGKKLMAYRDVLAAPHFREQVSALLRKSIRDHERFLSHFDTLDGPPAFEGNIAERTEFAFLLSESLRPGSHSKPPPLPDSPPVFTTYHPLLVESHFSILICYILLGDFPTLLPAFARAAALVDGLEGYPVFLPARSMAQAEFIEVLERLAGGWKPGLKPHSLMGNRLTIEAPPSPPLQPAPDLLAPAPSTGPSNPQSGRATPSTTGKGNATPAIDLAEALDCARMLLAPVVKRQSERAEKAAADKAAGIEKKKSLSINIPLHGPRVEVILAWLGAVYLPDMEGM